MVDSEGIAPSSPTCENGVFLFDDEPRNSSGLDGDRTRLILVDSEVTSLDVSEAKPNTVVEPEGIAPSSQVCQTRILLLKYGPAVAGREEASAEVLPRAQREEGEGLVPPNRHERRSCGEVTSRLSAA
jgi:hypothetical protein